MVDNYRWLEDVNKPEVKDWFKAQGDYAKTVLDKIPGRDSLIDTFVQYDKLRTIRYGEISKRGNRYFYRKTLPAETVGKLYVREGKTGAETLLFDPVAYDNSKKYAVSSFRPSPNGQQVVIGLQEGGAELSTLRTLDVTAKTFQPESITAVFGGGLTGCPITVVFCTHPATPPTPKTRKGT